VNALHQESSHSFAESDKPAATCVCRTDHGNLHAGIAYRSADGHHILHLAFHNDLRLDDAWPGGGAWAAPSVPAPRLRALAGRCRQVWRRFQETKSLPFGFGLGDSSFFPETGELRLDSGLSGLTCATFTLAVYRSCGLELVAEDTWPERVCQDYRFVDETFAPIDDTVQILQRLKSEVLSGTKRIYPEELLAATTAAQLPAQFSDIAATLDKAISAIGESAKNSGSDSESS